MPVRARNLTLAQLDDLLADAAARPPLAAPKSGWTRAIRDALGMTQAQLAARVGVSRSSIQDLERAESQRRITLDSLDRLARALGCRVEYTFVPEAGSLAATRKLRAQSVADESLRAASHSMRLEDQAVTPREHARQREALIDDLLRAGARKLWR